MKKTLIYTVSLAILAVAAFNTYLMATGQADAHTLVETVAVYGIVIFLAAAYFVKTVGKPSFPSWRKREMSSSLKLRKIAAHTDTAISANQSLMRTVFMSDSMTDLQLR